MIDRADAAKLSDEQLLEKLRAFGLEVDRAELERLCEGALSVEDVAWPLLDRCGVAASEGRPHEDWIWLCLLELWRRWWPERVCVEFLGDKIQAGYDAIGRREETSGVSIWLDAWSDVVRICELTGIDSVRQFDDRCPMYQSLFNWSQDLEDALWNAGLKDPEFLRARIAVCEEALRRFPDEDELIVENRRRAVAESYFELGDSDKAEALFEQRQGGGAVRTLACRRSAMGMGLDRMGRPPLLLRQPAEGPRPRRGTARPRLRDVGRQGPGGHRRSARDAVPGDRP